MKFEVQEYEHVKVVDINGELTGEHVDTIKDLASTLVNNEVRGVVLDMNNVGFIDSKALETLLWFRDYCNEKNRHFKLAALDTNCSKIFEITRLDLEFDIYDELAQAVKSFV